MRDQCESLRVALQITRNAPIREPDLEPTADLDEHSHGMLFPGAEGAMHAEGHEDQETAIEVIVDKSMGEEVLLFWDKRNEEATQMDEPNFLNVLDQGPYQSFEWHARAHDKFTPLATVDTVTHMDMAGMKHGEEDHDRPCARACYTEIDTWHSYFS